jgi:c-di-GMP-binding flagellar brake protein YcgR
MSPQDSSRREHSRFSLMGSLPGTFKTTDQTPLEVLPVDVSASGLGLLIDPAPKPGDQIEWQSPNSGKMKLKLIWSIEAEVGTSFDELSKMRRCGLVLEDSNLDLIEICKNQNGLQIIE